MALNTPPATSFDFFGIGMVHGYTTPINVLPNDILIDIFDFFRKSHFHEGSLSWEWHILVHVCQRWRQIVFASPCRLDLRIRCVNGTPVRKNLDIWPAFPIVIDYGYDFDKRITPSDEDNIIAALEHPGRVCYVRLKPRVTSSLLGKMATVMEKSFPALTHIHIHSDGNAPVLSGKFLGGFAPCLQNIEFWGISFPALPNLLLSSSGLVSLELHDIPETGYISPEAMVAILTTLTSLKHLHIDFQSPNSRPDRTLSPPVTRTALPVLTSISFFGDHEYLEYLVASIDAARLDSILILYLNPVSGFQVPQLCKFINRSEITKRSLPRRCHITLQSRGISLNLDATIYKGDNLWVTSPHIDVGFNCQLDRIAERVSLVAQLSSRISPLLSNVIHFVIHWTGPPCRWQGTDGVEWLQLLRPFTSMQTLFVSTKFAEPVARALEDVTGEMVTEVLPALDLLCLEDLPVSSIAKFCEARQLSGCPLNIVGTSWEFGQKFDSYQRA